MPLVRYVPNPLAARLIGRGPEVKAQLFLRAQNAADAAQGFAPVLTGAYRDSIHAVLTDDGAAIEASDYKAVWIEFGTGHPGPTPAFAPLRLGAESAGLHFQSRHAYRF